MDIPFRKMHGAGNDFIVVDDREGRFPLDRTDWLQAVAHRRFGVGSDGFLLVQPPTEPGADVRMRFINPDGGEVDMCGNGARCLARFAHDLGAAPARLTLQTPAGPVGAEVRGDQVRLAMTEPRDWRLGRTLRLDDGTALAYDFVNSGVEHVVVAVDDLDAVDLARLGPAIRYHADFAPRGTNANVVQITGPDALRIRTYERGVEDETLACGTGMVAAGLLAYRTGRVSGHPVRITCASGTVLEVDFEEADDTLRHPTLYGPAVYVFDGALQAPG